MRQRVQWIDAAKGIGILLVLLGHAPRDIMRSDYTWIDFCYYFIYTFHMHFFFFLSGYVFALSSDGRGRQSFLAFLKGKLRGLLVPWAIFSLLVYGVIFLFNQIPSVASLTAGTILRSIPFGEYLTQSIAGSNPYCTHVWYIYTLFFVQILAYLLREIWRKITGRQREPLAFWIGLELLASLLYLFLPVELPVAVSVKGYVLYYLLGVICCRVRRGSPGQGAGGVSGRFPFWAFPGPLLCGINVLAVDMGFLEGAAVRLLVSGFAVFLGAPLMIALLVWISQKVSGNRVLLWFGRNSFTIYLLHQPFACAVLGTVLTMLLPQTLPFYLLTMAACIGASVVFPVLVVKIADKIGLGGCVRVLTGGRANG